MKTGHVNTRDPLVQRLHAVVDSFPYLRSPARLYEAILPLVRDADVQVASLPLDTLKLRACLETGMPVLSCFGLETDIQELEGLLLQLARSVELMDVTGKRQRGWKLWYGRSDMKGSDGQSGLCLLQEAAVRIRTAYETGCLDLGEILSYAADGNYAGVANQAEKLRLDPDLLRSLAQNALKPVLQSCRRELMPLAAGLHWDKGYCFICGSWATLGELQDNDQTKHLRCGQCGADWQFSRLQCLQCGNEDHNTQRYLYPESLYLQMRVEVCELCNGYLKVISTFSPTPPEMLPVEDLATLHLDYIAREHGYIREP